MLCGGDHSLEVIYPPPDKQELKEGRAKKRLKKEEKKEASTRNQAVDAQHGMDHIMADEDIEARKRDGAGGRASSRPRKLTAKALAASSSSSSSSYTRK